MKKLFTLLVLLVAIVTGAQAQTTKIADVDFTSSDWTGKTFSQGNTTTPDVINGITFYSKNSSKQFSLADNTTKGLTFPNNNVSSNNYLFAIPISGIGGEFTLTVKHAYNSAKASFKYAFKENEESFPSSISVSFKSDMKDAQNADTEMSIKVTTTAKKGMLYIGRSGSDFTNIKGFTVTTPVTASETFTVEFDAGSNGTCATPSLTEATPGAGVTLPAVTANKGYGFTGWYTDVTDETTNVGDAGEKYNPTANITLTAGYAALTTPTITVEANATTVAKNENVTLTATVTGNPKPTLQWYSNTSASTSGGTAIEGATATTYAPSTATPKTYYFYAVATNSQGSATSAVQTITVTKSNKCKLSAVNYSNGFKAFIKQPGEGNGTVEAYYMEGTTAPTIASVEVSEGASCTESGNTLTVTAEDGTTTAVFDITLAAVAPYTGTGTHTFDGNETWVKTGNTFSSNGWKIARSYENDDEGKYMISQGSNRAYLFLGPNASVTITQGGTARSMKASVNGGAYGSATNKDIVVTGDPTAPYMIEITQTASNGGDGAIKSINITPSTVSVKVTDAKYATFVPSAAVTFEDADVKGYAAVYNSTKGSAELVEVTAVPAGTPVVVYAAVAGTYHLNIASEATAPASNDLKVSDGTVKGDLETIYGLKSGTKGVGFYPVTQNATIADGKVYLQIPASEGAREFIGFGGEEVVTGIDAIENGTIDNDAPAYNLAGQKVGKGYKGIVIINGKKVVK